MCLDYNLSIIKWICDFSCASPVLSAVCLHLAKAILSLPAAGLLQAVPTGFIRRPLSRRFCRFWRRQAVVVIVIAEWQPLSQLNLRSQDFILALMTSFLERSVGAIISLASNARVHCEEEVRIVDTRMAQYPKPCFVALDDYWLMR